MGTVLEEVCKIVPDGALIFFPSYKLMDKLCARWRSTGQWRRLSDEKQLFVGNKIALPDLIYVEMHQSPNLCVYSQSYRKQSLHFCKGTCSLAPLPLHQFPSAVPVME